MRLAQITSYLPGALSVKSLQIRTDKPDLSPNAIATRVGPRHAHGLGIQIKGFNWSITELRRGDRQDSGSAPNIQERLARAWNAAADQLAETKCRRRMMSRPKAEARIESQGDLALARPPTAPTRLDQQRPADRDWPEMAFP